jgi:hypothetical protein
VTSPDFLSYVNLTVFDKQPRDLYDEAVDYAKLVLPELEVRAGTLEDALLQSMSYVGGELIASINRLPNGLMEGILNLMGFARQEATYATGSVIFEMIDNDGAIIPTGTQVGYTETVDGISTFHTFSTIASVTIAAGSTTSTAVNIIADSAGIKPALLIDQPMIVVSASNRILSAELGSALVSGLSSESDNQYFSRGATFLASLSSSLTTSSQVQQYILNTYPDVHRCYVYDLTKLTTVAGFTNLTRASGTTVTATIGSGHGIAVNDIVRVVGAVPAAFNGTFVVTASASTTITWADSGSNESTTTDGTLYHFDSLATAAADQPGFVTIFVSDESGESLSSTDLATIKNDVEEKTVAGLTIGIEAPILVNITAVITLRTKVGYSTLSIQDAVDAYLTELLSPGGWDWSSRLRVNQIIARITQIAGVDYVATLVFTIDSGYSNYATVDGATGDVIMTYRGALPVSTITVSEAA